MGAGELEARLRMLARHHWVRLHGTPRVSTLVGDLRVAHAVWSEWLRLAGRTSDSRTTITQPATGDLAWLTTAAGAALNRSTESAGEPLAILVTRDLFARWRGGHDDRVGAFISEGVVEVGEVPVDLDEEPPSLSNGTGAVPPRGGPAQSAPSSPGGAARAAARVQRARSVAEMVMFDALEATPSTAGRFRLNEPLSFHFGGRAVEVDLLSRDDGLAIEIDGYHHFTDAEHYRRDRRKDLLLQAHGHVVLRFLAEDIIADAAAAVRNVVELLGLRRARAPWRSQ